MSFVEMIPKELQKGTTIDIAWKRDGLLVSVDSAPAVFVKNSYLPKVTNLFSQCWIYIDQTNQPQLQTTKAFFSMYLDQKCVDQTLKKSLGVGIAELVTQATKK